MFRLVVAALILLSPTTLQAQTLSPAETTEVDRIVTETLAKTGVPSASIAVVRGGKIAFARAYGKQSDAIPVARSDALYQIASISKQFTAAALLLLEDEGKLSLDDPVSKYVPGISGGDTIKLRQLLDHTSGLQDYWPQDYSFKDMESPITPQGIIDRWAKKPLDFPPGTQWQYSNTGYVVAGLVVEKVAGKPLLDFLQARIFKPLGIKAIDQDLAVGKGYPQGFHRSALGPVRVAKPATHGWLFAAGELAMSATDLAKWDIARIDRTVLPAEDWEAQERTTQLTDGTDTSYGLGVFAGKADGRRVIAHGGEAVGFLSDNSVFPAERAAIVVLTNSDFSNATSAMTSRIAALLFPAAPAADAEVAQTARARAMFDALRGGTLDRAMLTEHADYYFNAETAGDYRASLAPLGEPTSFEPAGKPRLRGGFVNRNYRISYGDRKLVAITYAEPGAAGRYEQFLIQPAE